MHRRDRGEQHVQGEPDGEVQDHADDRGGDGAPAPRAKALLARSASTNGAPRKIQRKQGVKVTQVVRRPPSVAGQQRRQGTGLAEGGQKADELRDHDQRPGRRLGHAEAVQHLAWLQPVIVLDRLLGDIGQYRVGAAEGDDGHLG